MPTEVADEQITALPTVQAQATTGILLAVTDETIAALKSEYGHLSVASVTDEAGAAKCREGRLKCVRARTSIEKARKELKADVLERGRLIDGEAKRLTTLVERLEEHLLEQENIVVREQERIAKEKADQVYADRVERLIDVDAASDVPESILRGMTDAEFESRVKEFAERKRLRHEELTRKAEEEAEQKRQQEAEAERQRIEAARLAAERAELERKQREQEAAARQERERIEEERRQQQAELDRQKREQEETQRIERERIEAANRAEQERLDKIRRDQEAEAERVRLEQAEAQRKIDEEKARVRKEREDALCEVRRAKLIQAVGEPASKTIPEIALRNWNDEEFAEHVADIQQAQRELAEREARELAERVRRQEEAAERRRQEEEAARLRAEALRPDREKLVAYADAILAVALPDVSAACNSAAKECRVCVEMAARQIQKICDKVK